MAKKFAIQTYTRDKNGTLKATLIDAKTGAPVSAANAKNYDIVTTTDYDAMTLTGKLPGSDNTDNKDTKTKDDNKPAAPKPLDPQAGNFGGDRNNSYTTSGRGNSTAKSDRTAANSWGFKHKPGWLGAASAVLPGLPGVAAKAASIGYNVNSMTATDKARKDLGMEPSTTKDAVKGIIKDNQGYLGKTKIGSKDYGVQLGEGPSFTGGGVVGDSGGIGNKVKGFLGLDTKGGQTNLTPQEMQTRKAMSSTMRNVIDKTSMTPEERQAEMMAGAQSTKSFGTKTQATAANPNSAVDPTHAQSYAQLAAQGYIQRTPEEKEAIAHALAGEMSGATLQGLVNGDPKAQAEFANMVTTVENRIGKVGSVGGVLKGSQYNSLLPSVTINGVTTHPLATTDNNFAKYKDAIMGTLDGYYSGTVQPTSYSYTNYYNPSITTPKWSNETFTKTGYHAFGVTPDWAQSAEEAYGIEHPNLSLEGTPDFSKMSFAEYSTSYYDRAAKAAEVAAKAMASMGSMGNTVSHSSFGANRPATMNMNSGASNPSNPSQMGGVSMSSGFGKANTNTANRGSSNNSGFSGYGNMGGFGAGTSNTHNNTNTNNNGFSGSSKSSSPSNPSQMGGTGMSSGLGSSNTNNHNNDKNKNDQGATGSYGYGGFGGPR